MKTQKTHTVDGVAIDLGGTKLSVTRFKSNQVAIYKQLPTNPDATPAEHVEAIVELLQFAETHAEDKVGIAVSGRVDSDGNWHAVNSGTLKQVTCVAIAKMLSLRTGRKLSVLNDTYAAALGEAQLGAGLGSDRFAYITVSTGIGGTCVIDGLPLNSPNGLAGHAGFVTSRFSHTRCGSGRYATVESIASGRAIANAAQMLGHKGITAKQVFEQHNNGADWASEIVELSARAIADLIGNLTAIVGIDRVVIGGSIGLADGYTDLLQIALQNEPELFSPRLLSASLAEHSAALGVLLAQG